MEVYQSLESTSWHNEETDSTGDQGSNSVLSTITAKASVEGEVFCDAVG